MDFKLLIYIKDLIVSHLNHYHKGLTLVQKRQLALNLQETLFTTILEVLVENLSEAQILELQQLPIDDNKIILEHKLWQYYQEMPGIYEEMEKRLLLKICSVHRHPPSLSMW